MEPKPKPQIITGNSLAKLLLEKGIVPPNTRRVVIEIGPDRALLLHYETFGDQRLVDVVAAAIVESNPAQDDSKQDHTDE